MLIVKKAERERKILYDITHMWNLKKIQQTSKYNKKEADSQRTNQWLLGGGKYNTGVVE